MFEDIGKMTGKFGGSEVLKGYLSGISFPVEKNELMQFARNKGIPDTVVGLLNRLPEDKKFQNADEVARETETLQ